MLMRIPFFMSWLIFCCCYFRKSACMTSVITDLIATRMLTHVFCSSSPASFSGFPPSLTCLSTCLIHSSLLLPSPLMLCFDQLLSSLSSPPHSAFLHLPSFFSSILLLLIISSSILLCAILFSELWIFPLLLIRPVFLSSTTTYQIKPLTHSNTFHQLHKHTRGTKHVMVLRGTSSSLLLFSYISPSILSPSLSVSLSLFPLKVSVNNKLEKWKWGDNCESPFCVPSRASVKFSVWLKASFLWCAVWKLS